MPLGSIFLVLVSKLLLVSSQPAALSKAASLPNCELEGCEAYLINDDEVSLIQAKLLTSKRERRLEAPGHSEQCATILAGAVQAEPQLSPFVPTSDAPQPAKDATLAKDILLSRTDYLVKIDGRVFDPLQRLRHTVNPVLVTSAGKSTPISFILKKAQTVEQELHELVTVDLPEYLVKIGEDIFGSRQRLEETLSNTPMAQAAFAGKSLTLTSAKEDNTLQRLMAEMPGDHYCVQQVKAQHGVIVDVGSNIGDFAISAALAHPSMQVVAVEPSPHTYFYLLLNLHLNNIALLAEDDLGHPDKAGVFAINAAVTRDGREVNIKWSNENSQNAAIDTQEAGVSTWDSASVPSLQMEQFLASHGINSVELFKIDCEGCEFEVLPSIQKLILEKNRVKLLVGEIHQSLRDASIPTQAKKPSPEEILATDSVLEQRGCALNSWPIYC